MENLEHYKWLFSLPSLVAISLFGMFCHFLKANVKGETTTEIKNYFKDHAKSTFLAAAATVVATITMYFSIATGTTIDITTVFLIGLGADSTLNKWDAKANSQ